jgi:hypothetical protein
MKHEDTFEWYDGEWCTICALTIGMAKQGCEWRKQLKGQGKECQKLLAPIRKES